MLRNFFVFVTFLWFLSFTVEFFLFSHFLFLVTAALLSFLLWDRSLLGFIFKISHFFFSVSSNFINDRRIYTHIQMITKTLRFSFLDKIFSVSWRLFASCFFFWSKLVCLKFIILIIWKIQINEGGKKGNCYKNFQKEKKQKRKRLRKKKNFKKIFIKWFFNALSFI